VDDDDRWVDDPASSLYNSWQREPVAGRWSSAEELVQPEYAYAQVVGVNEERVLRWQRPGAVLVVTCAG